MVFAIIGCLLAAVGYFQPTRNEKIVWQLVQRGFCTDSLTAEVEEAMRLFLTGSKYEHLWQINRQPQRDCVNFYVLRTDIAADDPRLPRQARRFLNTCAYIGSPQLIVIDAGFIERFLDDRSTFPAMRHPPREVQKRALVLWIIGHEIGHLLCGHRPRHFEPGDFTTELNLTTDQQSNVQRSEDHRVEYDADDFCLRHLRKDPERKAQVISFLYALVNSEIHGKIGVVPAGVGILFDYTNRKIVEYFNSPTHPEYVIRLATLLRLDAALERDSGSVAMVDEFWEQLGRSGPTTPSNSSKANIVCHVHYQNVKVEGARVVLRPAGTEQKELVATTDFNGYAVFRNASRDHIYLVTASSKALTHLGYPANVEYSGTSQFAVTIPQSLTHQFCEVSLVPKLSP
jgi:hypothetical protein